MLCCLKKGNYKNLINSSRSQHLESYHQQNKGSTILIITWLSVFKALVHYKFQVEIIDRAHHPKDKRCYMLTVVLGLSRGMGNLTQGIQSVGCWFGILLLCHSGAGGSSRCDNRGVSSCPPEPQLECRESCELP